MSLDAKVIGARIKRLRIAKHLTQKQLAAKLKVHHSPIGEWERGRFVPTLAVRKKIAAVLDTDVESLFSDESERLAEAREKAIDKTIKLLKGNKAPTPAELNAASSALARAKSAAEKSASTLDEEIRERMKGAKDRVLGKLARLRLD